MARFEKLEFNEPKGRKPEPAASAATPSVPKPSRALEADWMAKADAQRRTGFYENALKYYSRALEQDRAQVDGWLGQVQMLVLLEEHPEAELWARKALELFPSHGDLMAGRAQALCRMKDAKRAHQACDGALKQSGQSAYRWIVRGEILLAGRQTTEQYCFDKAQQIDSDWLVPVERWLGATRAAGATPATTGLAPVERWLKATRAAGAAPATTGLVPVER